MNYWKISVKGSTRPTTTLKAQAEGVDHPPETMQVEKKARPLLEYPALLYGLIGIVGLLVLLVFAMKSGLDTPFASSDARQYAAIGASIAHGSGYRDPVGFWPTEPAYDRMPVFPLILSLGMGIAPNALDEVVLRLTNVVCLALAGVAIGALCRRLGVRPVLCLVGGLYVSLSPILIHLALEGLSEISFILIVSAGLAFAFSGPRYLYLAAVLLGLGPLVRTNFILVPLVFAALALLYPSARRALIPRATVKRAALALCLTLLPAAIWVTRNYALTGRFPLLSSIGGETFYGANNERAASDLNFWGGWVFPDAIPGETPKAVLAKRLPSDLALSDYYYSRGMAWTRNNVARLPRLVLGKIVRGFVPIPWANSPSPQEYMAFCSRLVLQVLFLITIPFWWPGMNRQYLLFLAALGISHLITTVLFFGLVRYTFCFLEVFTVPCVGFGIDRWLDRRRRAKASFAVVLTS
jgi:hypothetical protein